MNIAVKLIENASGSIDKQATLNALRQRLTNLKKSAKSSAESNNLGYKTPRGSEPEELPPIEIKDRSGMTRYKNFYLSLEDKFWLLDYLYELRGAESISSAVKELSDEFGVSPCAIRDSVEKVYASHRKVSCGYLEKGMGNVLLLRNKTNAFQPQALTPKYLASLSPEVRGEIMEAANSLR